MNKLTRLNTLYGNIIGNGGKIVDYNRIMENFYFTYDISKEYAVEDLDNMTAEIDRMKANLRSFKNVLWEMKNELETKVSAVKHYAKCKNSGKRRGAVKRF